MFMLQQDDSEPQRSFQFDHMLPTFLTLSAAIGFVFAGNLVAKYIPPLNRFSLPGAVVGGLFALVMGPQVIEPGFWPLPDEAAAVLYGQLAEFPALFINVVFACLMLGRHIGAVGVIWKRAKPQIIMGHVFAWGQYVVGLTVSLVLLAPLFGLNALTGPLIAIGFQGGHGTAAGLGPKFEELGFAAGKDFALTVATFGVLVGVVLGPLLANMLRRHGLPPGKVSQEPPSRSSAKQDQSDLPQRLQPNPLTGRLTVHLALVCLAIGSGWLALQGLQSIEHFLRPQGETYLTHFIPLFSVVLIAGMALQVFLQTTGLSAIFDRDLFEKISSFALDMVIVSALATLSLTLIREYWQAILLLCGAGFAWNIGVLLILGPRVYPKPWYAFGLGDFGGGTATTASGIMLIKTADPHEQTGALEAYADKQPFYEPIMGGGLVTAMALPTVAFLGPVAALGITASVLAVWLFFAWRLAFRNRNL